MHNSTNNPAWLVYERCVSLMIAEKFGREEVVIQPNALVVGVISGKERQIDVLVDARYPDINRDRMIVDAKHRKSKVDIKDIESFEGMMRDCNANRGVIVCTAGYTDGALRRAQEAITISIMTMDQALALDWAFEPCLGDCDSRMPGHRGMLLWGPTVAPAFLNRPTYVSRIGKCDGCHQFHVWCDACGRKFIVPDTKVVDCDCGSWISVPEAAESEDDGVPESIWLLFQVEDDTFVMDRRPIHSPWAT